MLRPSFAAALCHSSSFLDLSMQFAIIRVYPFHVFLVGGLPLGIHDDRRMPSNEREKLYSLKAIIDPRYGLDSPSDFTILVRTRRYNASNAADRKQYRQQYVCRGNIYIYIYIYIYTYFAPSRAYVFARVYLTRIVLSSHRPQQFSVQYDISNSRSSRDARSSTISRQR